MSDDIPNTWTRVAIEQLIELNPKNTAHDEALVGFVPMTLVGRNYRSKIGHEPRKWGEVKKGYTHFADGDVLLAKITPCFENGKAGIVDGLPNNIGAGSTEYFVCRCNSKILEKKYLLAFLKTSAFLQGGETNMTGTVGHKRVPKEFLLSSQIPLAPLNEQKRIVDKLELVFDRIDVCRERLDQIPSLLKRFRQSVLAAASGGRLIQELRSEKHSVVAEQNESELPELPESWRWELLENVCSAIVDCPHSTPKWSPTGEICVRTTNFLPGNLDLSSVSYVSEQVYKERTARLVPQTNDILYSREGGILGVACIVPQKVKLCLGQRMMLMRANATIYEPRFLMHILNSPYILSMVKRLTGGTASPHLNVRDVKNFPVPLPPVLEQKRIVEEIDRIFSAIKHIENSTSNTQRMLEALCQSVLLRAFRGELIPQDTNDETAKELLTRIQMAGSGKTVKAEKILTRR